MLHLKSISGAYVREKEKQQNELTTFVLNLNIFKVLYLTGVFFTAV